MKNNILLNENNNKKEDTMLESKLQTDSQKNMKNAWKSATLQNRKQEIQKVRKRYKYITTAYSVIKYIV